MDSTKSDTWNDILALKSKNTVLREKLAQRRLGRQQVEAELIAGTSDVASSQPASIAAESVLSPSAISGLSANLSATSNTIEQTIKSEFTVGVTTKHIKTEPGIAKGIKSEPGLVKNIKSESVSAFVKTEPVKISTELLNDIEKRLITILSDINLALPLEASHLSGLIGKQLNVDVPLTAIEDILQKLSAQNLLRLITVKDEENADQSKCVIDNVDNAKLAAVYELDNVQETVGSKKRKHDGKHEQSGIASKAKQTKRTEMDKKDDTIENLLSMQSAKERENKKLNDEIHLLLSTPTAKEQSMVEKFKSQGAALQEFCPCGTKEECLRVNGLRSLCGKLHFKKIIQYHTDESLGDCSFLNTCFHMETCKYVHYTVDYPQVKAVSKAENTASKGVLQEESTILFPEQWIMCDLRTFDMSVLGKFAVVMADPPWDIHMELPYGTMGDDEMRRLNIPVLQDDGYLFLWVTGRAMELGRECLKLWGYERIDELIWVKTNQLQRIIRTGRTGHWLNHGKEHCLIGAKGNPKNMNRGLDCDVIVAEVRATSHKPDEVYGIIERLSPGTRKLELFGRPHNVQPNWITLGNQVDGVKLIEPEVVKGFKKRYPDGDAMKPPVMTN